MWRGLNATSGSQKGDDLQVVGSKEVESEKPEEPSPDAMGRRLAVVRDNPCFTCQALYGAVDNGLEFGGVFCLAFHCQSAACLFNAEPGGVAVFLVRRLGVTDLQEESLHDEFFDTFALPGVAFGLQIEVKMLRVNHSHCPGLF